MSYIFPGREGGNRYTCPFTYFYLCTQYIYIKQSLHAMYSTLNTHWKDWYWSWSSNTLGTWWEELTHWKRPWCWERLKAGAEEDDRRWDGWVASPTQWTWVWASSRRRWRTGKLGVLQSVGSQRVGHNWVTEQWQRSFCHSRWIATGCHRTHS